ncbi:MAG: hypothetical protein H8E62_06905 [Planctomycetes bacterium]|nr:hypothetical protein [Planctomycetota bacterium]
MSLVKWIRKNNRKIMVFVVIFCMIAFVVGYTGLQIISSVFDPGRQAVAHYNDGQKMRINDLRAAQNELSILRMIRSDQLTASQGLSGALLSRLIFPESPLANEIPSQLKQAVQQGQLQLSLEELDAYFNQQPERPENLWILLKAEAYKAGTIVSTEQAKETLRDIVPQMMGIDAAQLVQQIIRQNNLTEDQIARTFADLLSVLEYANTVVNNEAVTLNQVKAFVGRSKERLDVEFVKVPAKLFVDENAAVSDADIQKQFENFKASMPNDPTPENPFGFGYRLPKRVQVEYMVIKTDDIKSQIASPTSEAMEDYYSRNVQQFQQQVPVNPNNPDSEKTTVIRPYVEVERSIRQAIEKEKADNLASLIFNEIKNITELGFEKISFDEATVDQLQTAAGDYQAAGQEILKNFQVPVTVGKTGWLSIEDFQQEKILKTLQVQAQQRNPIKLIDLAFIASSDAKQTRRRIGLPTVRLWQNIGPVEGYGQEEQKYHPLVALIRVIGVENATVPESVDVSYDTKGVALFEDPDVQNSFSLKENIKEDLLLVKAMESAKARTEELKSLIESKGWDEAVESYNAKYAKDSDNEESGDQTIRLEKAEQQLRASGTEIAFAKKYIQENPAMAALLQQGLVTDMLNGRFYKLLEDGSDSTGSIYQVLAFEPEATCYVVKEVIRQPATITDYLENKASTAFQLNMQDTPASTMIHFAPDNILKRMNYQLKKDEVQTPDETKTEETVE